MIFKPHSTHIIPTIMLIAAAALPTSPLWTIAAYGDTETSAANMLRAGMWGEVLQIEQFSLLLADPANEPLIDDGEVAGTSTEPELDVEVGEPVVETTIDDEPPAEETPAPEEPVVEVGEPTVDITTPEEPAPEEEPAEEPGPSTDEEAEEEAEPEPEAAPEPESAEPAE